MFVNIYWDFEDITYLHGGSQLLPILRGRGFHRCFNVSVHYHLEALNLQWD